MSRKFQATKFTGAEDVKIWTRDVTTATNRGMLARTWEELEFRLDVLRATRVAYIELLSVYGKETLSMYP
jgi:hypothetical protein